MDKIEQKIKSLNDIELPDGLHGRIVRSVIMRRYRSPFFVVSAAIILNVLISGWRINVRVFQNGAISAFGSFFSGFSMDYDFVSDFFRLVMDYIPLPSLFIFLINLALLGYVSKLFFDIVKYDRYVDGSSLLTIKRSREIVQI